MNCRACSATIVLLGAREVRERFGGISQPTFKYWRDELDFPEPDTTIAAGPIWDMETVFQWGVRTQRLMDRRGVKLP